MKTYKLRLDFNFENYEVTAENENEAIATLVDELLIDGTCLNDFLRADEIKPVDN